MITENTYFKYVNLNSKERLVDDCVVRAIANACQQSWEQTVREMTELGIEKGCLLNDPKLIPIYLKKKEFAQMKEPRKTDNTKMTVKEWLGSRDGWLWHSYRIVAVVGSHHITAIIDNQVQDTWNCSNKTMHKWWVK